MNINLSRYNTYKTLPDKSLLIFNTVTSNFIKYKSEGIKNIDDNKELLDQLLKDKKTLVCFLEKGFLVDYSAVDELGNVKKRFNEAIDSDYGLRLAILLTLDCNFACDYCCENRIHTRMNTETASKILEFIGDKLQKNTKKDLHILWFGGEPLLEIPTLFALTDEIKKICSKLGRKCHFFMTSNGYFLKNLCQYDVSKLELKELKVTLDGLEETHNKRRPLSHNNGGTFQEIISGIKIAINKIKIKIRINIDQDNIKEIPALLNYLMDEKILKGIDYNVEFAFVDRIVGKGCTSSSCYNHLTSKENARMEYELLQMLARLGGKTACLPKSYFHVCSAQLKNAYSIDPDGNMYKCINDSSMPEERIGHIDSYNNLNNEEKYILSLPFSDAACSNCKCLPFCCGGCPQKKAKQTSHSYLCSLNKYNLKDKMVLSYGGKHDF